ncbi:MAG: serine--tRNA ligase [Alphaproteobacteria bacterium]|nr:serine--tRNA ligase [Rickettsiales bacterium]
MISINYIINNRDEFKKNILARNVKLVSLAEYSKKVVTNEGNFYQIEQNTCDLCIDNCEEKPFCIEYIITLDLARRNILQQLESARRDVNRFSEEIAIAKRSEKDSLSDVIKKLKENSISAGIAVFKMEETLRVILADLKQELSSLPNIIDDSVPIGCSEDDNVEVLQFGKKKEFNFLPKEHYDLGCDIKMLNFDLGSKICGTRTSFMFSGLARLHRALATFMLDLHTNKHNFTEVLFPTLIRPNSLYCTGQLSSFNFSSDLFHISNVNQGLDKCKNEKDSKLADNTENAYINGLDMVKDLFLSPTGEVPLVNILSKSIIEEEDLPIRFVGYSECFRKEAGAGGKDVKGIMRQKQFGKVELVTICSPENSEKEHSKILTSAEAVLQALGLHYRVMLLCSGDIGFASKKTYDIEVWLPAQKRYREISSCSNTGDFQTRRCEIKIRSGKKKRYAYSLNGSGVAIGRVLIAIMENYQNSDNSITIPDVLIPYMGGMKKITPHNESALFKYI